MHFWVGVGGPGEALGTWLDRGAVQGLLGPGQSFLGVLAGGNHAGERITYLILLVRVPPKGWPPIEDTWALQGWGSRVEIPTAQQKSFWKTAGLREEGCYVGLGGLGSWAGAEGPEGHQATGNLSK